MHVDFDPVKVEWSALDISDGEEQIGGYQIFRGIPYQRGSGLGSVFRSFLRYLVPIGKKIGVAVGQEGLRTGNRVLSNVLEGKDLKETMVTESKAGLKNLLEKAANNLDKQKGKGFDFRRYKDVKEGGIAKVRRVNNINRLASTLGPPNLMPIAKKQRKTKKGKKRLRIDAFGAY